MALPPYPVAPPVTGIQFARIPESSPMGFVLESVPGTVEANDAVLLAQIPHKATIKIKDATVDVAYEGAPSFKPIQGTSMEYAVNTGYEVIKTYVKLGLGISIVMSHCLVGDEQLFRAPVGRYFPSRSYGLVLRKARRLTPATECFIQVLCPGLQLR